MLGILLSAGAFLSATASTYAEKCDDTRLSFGEARNYLLGLINQDRERKGLKPVQLDPIAALAGQKHAEEMATQRFMSHWNREGKMPDHRYTEAGGRDHVAENVYLTTRYRGEEPKPPLDLDPAPEFTHKELEDIEEAYFNERPPYDGHRRNILDPNHTHVGIGLARAVRGDSARVLTNTMEFVDRYLDLESIPMVAKAGERVVVKGRALDGVTLRAITIGRTEPSVRMTREDLQKTGSYQAPSPYTTISPAAESLPRDARIMPDGRFEVAISLSDAARPGVYYVTIWVQDSARKSFVASQRTVSVN